MLAVYWDRMSLIVLFRLHLDAERAKATAIFTTLGIQTHMKNNEGSPQLNQFSGALGKLHHRAQQVETRKSLTKQLKNELNHDTASNELSEEELRSTESNLSSSKNVKQSSPNHHKRRRTNSRGKTSRKLLEKAKMELFNQETHKKFIQSPRIPDNEFPTIFSRLPIFVPGTRKKQRQILAKDEDMSLRIETPWGICTRMGPPLTIYDEDTLFGLSDLRISSVTGDPRDLPAPLSDMAAYKTYDQLYVDVVVATLTQLLEACGNKDHGDTFEDRFKSLKRLIGTTLIFEKLSTKNNILQPGKNIDIINANWTRWEEDGIFLIQFSPAMTYWMKYEFVYIDRKVRAQLTSDTGKAIHRFFSSCDKTYKISTRKLMQCIGYNRAYKYYMQDLKHTLEELSKMGWLRDKDITGTGRKIPHMVYIEKEDRKHKLENNLT